MASQVLVPKLPASEDTWMHSNSSPLGQEHMRCQWPLGPLLRFVVLLGVDYWEPQGTLAHHTWTKLAQVSRCSQLSPNFIFKQASRSYVGHSNGGCYLSCLTKCWGGPSWFCVRSGICSGWRTVKLRGLSQVSLV